MSVLRLSVLSAFAALWIASPVFAHPLDIAYLDFSHASSSETTLTVAVHPYQAFELVRAGQNIRFALPPLQTGSKLVAAYIADHVSVASASGPCIFAPTDSVVPNTELEAVADGITASAILSCPDTDPSLLHVTSSLFIEGFPKQSSIIRLEFPDGFAERTVLDGKTRGAAVDLSEIMRMPTSSAGVQTTDPRNAPQNQLAALAVRAISDDLGFWGFAGLLLTAIVVGALHAMGPGHGKALMAASLLGNHATPKRAIALAGVITITHVSDVVILALIASVVSVVLPIGNILQYLEIFSAASLVILGFVTLIRAVLRYRLILRNPGLGMSDDAHARAHALGLPHHHGHDADHDHAHSHHHHEHDHMHTSDSKTSFRRALWTGFLGALAPCPAAWAMFMATLASGHPAVGLLLLVAFTIGLATTLVSVGLLIITSSSFALRRTPARLTYALPVISSVLITMLGLILLCRLFV